MDLPAAVPNEGPRPRRYRTVDDPHDPRLAPFLGLRDHSLRRTDPTTGEGGHFVAESLLVVERVLASDLAVDRVVVTPEGLERLRGPLDARPDVMVLVAQRAVLAAVAGYDVHRGVLATVARPRARTATEVMAGARTLVVLEGIADQTNLGAIFRNAAGLGVDGVLLCPRCCDPLYRRTVRVSMGASWALPWARLSPWPDALGALREAGFGLVAFTPAGVPLTPGVPVRRAAEERVALLFGSEGDGLSATVLAAAGRRVAFPMSDTVDSLNVAAATAVGCWAFAAPGSNNADGAAPYDRPS